MYKLVIEDDEGSKQTVPVIRDEITIGRKEGNTIRLTERNVSRKHARVVRDDGKIYVEDVEARYGIKKNGSKIEQRAVFSPGDVITIGDYNLTLEAKKEAGSPGPNGQQPGPPAHRDLSEEKTRVTTRLDSGKKKKEKASASSEGTEIMPAMPAKIVVVSSNFAGQEFPLKNKEMVIGRGDDCDIIIDHRSVSSRHAKIVREPGGKYQIVDLNSKNGITVGGEEYRSTYLKRGDVIELGHVKFRFVEPGENYVFTPQSSPGIDVDSGGGLSNGVIVGTIAAVTIILAAGIFFMMSGDDGTDAETVAEATPTAAETSGSTGEESGAVVAGDDQQKDDEGAEAAKNVEEAIKQSQEDIEQGKLDRAIGRLDSAKQFLDPSPEQNDQIDTMLAEARNEQPFRRAYQSARSNLESENYLAALERLEEIPSHSVFAALVEDEGLAKEALDGLLSKAESALDEGENDEAKKLAEEALVFESENERAQTILASLDKASASEPVAAANNPSNSGGTGSSSNDSGGGRPPQKSRPAEPEVTREEAKALYRSAQKKLMSPDKNGAIRDCRKALKGGYTNCYRVLGVAYKMIGEKDKSCLYFKKYLGTGPSNPANVQRQMDKLGCN